MNKPDYAKPFFCCFFFPTRIVVLKDNFPTEITFQTVWVDLWLCLWFSLTSEAFFFKGKISTVVSSGGLDETEGCGCKQKTGHINTCRNVQTESKPLFKLLKELSVDLNVKFRRGRAKWPVVVDRKTGSLHFKLFREYIWAFKSMGTKWKKKYFYILCNIHVFEYFYKIGLFILI